MRALICLAFFREETILPEARLPASLWVFSAAEIAVIAEVVHWVWMGGKYWLFGGYLVLISFCLSYSKEGI